MAGCCFAGLDKTCSPSSYEMVGISHELIDTQARSLALTCTARHHNHISCRSTAVTMITCTEYDSTAALMDVMCDPRGLILLFFARLDVASWPDNTAMASTLLSLTRLNDRDLKIGSGYSRPRCLTKLYRALLSIECSPRPRVNGPF